MSISQALNTSLSGLRATQAGMAVIAGNVANAQTPGYVRKTLQLQTVAASDLGGSVRVAAVTREIDQYVQRQLRVETAGGGYADLRAQFYSRIQGLLGAPGSDAALETVFNNFTNALQALSTSPDSAAARSNVLSSAQVLTQNLNGLTTDVQSLRSDAESGISDSIASANDAMQKIAMINTQLSHSSGVSAADASLMDQRDNYVDQLSQLMDIRVVVGDHGEYNVFTNSGVQLVGATAAKLEFQAQGTVTANTQWDADPSKSTLGTIKLVQPNGSYVDLVANNSIRSGKIAAYLEMRDKTLPQLQSQLDAMAAAMSSALSNEKVPAQAGSGAGEFSLDTTGLQQGNTISLAYTDAQGKTHNLTLVRADDRSTWPLSNSVTADPNDEVLGVDFSGGMAGVVNQLNAKFGGKLTFSNPSGNVLKVEDAPSSGFHSSAMSMTRTASSLTGAGASLPFFTDGGDLYTGAITANGSQSVGLAGRIAVNPNLLADPSKLVAYNSSIAAGDSTRPDFIYQQLTGTSFAFGAETGLGNSTSPFSGDIGTYLRQVLSQQGEAASNATSLSQGQQVVVNALKQRFADQSGVNVDQEMANLLTLQTAYGANARVMSTVKDMFDMLLKM
ncbi:MAG: flagellar hook-associated protein FlgK [Pseudomonadota bacterium]